MPVRIMLNPVSEISQITSPGRRGISNGIDGWSQIGSSPIFPPARLAVKVKVPEGGAAVTSRSASVSSRALSAVRKRPPVSSAIHCICISASASPLTSKPMTWAVKSTPAASSARAAAQGSGLQVSMPSETRITVAACSVWRSAWAAAMTASVIGVMPRGFSSLTIRAISSAVPGAGATTVSISEHCPRSRWP